MIHKNLVSALADFLYPLVRFSPSELLLCDNIQKKYFFSMENSQEKENQSTNPGISPMHKKSSPLIDDNRISAFIDIPLFPQQSNLYLVKQNEMEAIFGSKGHFEMVDDK